MSQFVHLNVKSAYSLGKSAIPVKRAIKMCIDDGMPAMAIADINNMFGAMEFATVAASSGIQPILGASVQMKGGGILNLLVKSHEGYKNLSRIVSDGYTRGTEFEITLDDLRQSSEGLICLSGGAQGALALHVLSHRDAEAQKHLGELRSIFEDRFYIQIERHGLQKEKDSESGLLDLAYKNDIPIVATNECCFPNKSSHEAHDALLCIAGGRYITEEDRPKSSKQCYFKSQGEMRELFSDLPEAIDNTAVIAKRCSFLLKPIAPILPPFTDGDDEAAELCSQAKAGLAWRLQNFVKDRPSQPYWERLDHELKIIQEMGFPGYFLIVSDFIKWAKDNNIPVGPGRGSGAGSVVAWSLKITDLDPMELGLLFERFLNPQRVSMPDFDIDFCQERRDEVIEYVVKRYGRDRVAQIITFGTLQARAVVRDVGRVLQMPYGQVDRLAKMVPSNPAAPISLAQALDSEEDLRAERDKDETSKKLISIALELEGLYRHASTHAAGIVIGDRPLHELVPLYQDPRSNMPATQFNMKFVEKTGLIKFDFLGLKTMTTIQKTLDMLDDKIDLLQIPLDDEKTYDMMQKGDTCGVFQLESTGMRDLGRQMKIHNFEQIIALISLYRPGPMENIPRYIACLSGKEKPDYMHESLEPILKDTYGVMIYQEQVMQAAQILAGYSAADADLLRRAMGKRIKEEMDAQRSRFVSGAANEKGISEKKANAIFDQIAKFAGYGFNKAHAAGYALIAYWTGYLKAHFPCEFMAASMTLDAHNTDKLAVFKQELDALEIKTLPPCVNSSGAFFLVENGCVRYALGALKGVGEGAMEALEEERTKNGKFKDINDFVARLDAKVLNKRQMDNLISAGAFDCFNENRAQLLAGLEGILGYATSIREERESGQVNLFASGDDDSNCLLMPQLQDTRRWDDLETLSREFGAVGFYLSAHPMSGREDVLKSIGAISFVELSQKSQAALSANSRVKLAGVLIKKQEKVSKKSGNRYAFLNISDQSGSYEAVVFSDLLSSARDILISGAELLLTAGAEISEGQLRITVHGIEPLDKAVENASGSVPTLEIKVSNEAALVELKDTLDNAGAGRRKISIIVPVSNSSDMAILSISDKYSLGAKVIAKLKVIDGISLDETPLKKV